MLPPPFAWAGVDWSMSAHQVCLLRPHAKALQRSFPHSAAGLQEMVAWLASEAGCEPAALYTAIEVPHGPIVSALLAAGFSTFSINPKQLDRFRDRRSLAGAKDDRRDALTLADSLRTDLPAFSEVTLPDDLILAIRGASRRRDTLLADSRRFANRLRQMLWAAFPDVLTLCSAADEPWLWTLLERLTASCGRPLRKATLRKILADHRKRNVSPAALAAALDSPPVASGATLQTILDDIASLLPQLRSAHAALVATDARLSTLLDQAGETARILDSMPGIDRTLAAVFLAEAPEAIQLADLQALRSLAGTAPVTLQSGKSRAVHIRRACSMRLRNAVRHWARTAARCAPWTRAHYLAMRQRGLSHERALRGIADLLLNRLVACLRNRTPYDPALASRRELPA